MVTQERQEYNRNYYQKHKEGWSKRTTATRKRRKEKDPKAFREKENANQKNRKTKLKAENPNLLMWRRTRQSAKERNLEFTITPKDFTIPEICPILHIPLYFGEDTASGNSPSLDRIDNSKGYIPGNVAVISNRANRNKLDMSIEEIERLYKYTRGEL
jgi:hypothetical protein